jgi:hypothetical protein
MTENIETEYAHIDKCPLCGNAHDILIRVKSEPVMSMVLLTPGSPFQVYLTCPAKNQTFSVMILLNTIGRRITSVREKK